VIVAVGVQPDAGLAELIALYYRLVPAEELSTAEPAELAAAVQSHPVYTRASEASSVSQLNE
jgi:hypothetical protein